MPRGKARSPKTRRNPDPAPATPRLAEQEIARFIGYIDPCVCGHDFAIHDHAGCLDLECGCTEFRRPDTEEPDHD